VLYHGCLRAANCIDATTLGAAVFAGERYHKLARRSKQAMMRKSDFREIERAMIVQRVNAGLARARKAGVRLGRPESDKKHIDRARALLVQGGTIRGVAAACDLSVGKVQALKQEAAAHNSIATL
jgi:DNA invertase Pin-like site-specific DNA recombinase